jgi:hypothetical protein
MLPLLVDGRGDQFHVIRVDAGAIATQMIDHQMFGDVTAQPLEAEPVCQDIEAVKAEAAVASVGSSGPVPAFGGFVYFGPESLRWIFLHRLSVQWLHERLDPQPQQL